jgi:hypothetical protein
MIAYSYNIIYQFNYPYRYYQISVHFILIAVHDNSHSFYEPYSEASTYYLFCSTPLIS